MVGGKVINVVQEPERTWIQCMETTKYYNAQGRRTKEFNDTCAIWVKDAKEIKVGDSLWWQGNRAYWTPKPDDGREDVPLERIGFSHSNIPEDVMRSIL